MSWYVHFRHVYFLKKIMKLFRDFVKSTSIVLDLRTNQSITLNFITERKNIHDCAVEVTQKLQKSMQCEISSPKEIWALKKCILSYAIENTDMLINSNLAFP